MGKLNIDYLDARRLNGRKAVLKCEEKTAKIVGDVCEYDLEEIPEGIKPYARLKGTFVYDERKGYYMLAFAISARANGKPLVYVLAVGRVDGKPIEKNQNPASS